MGVYIKGMEMPTSCSVYPFCFGANNICPWTREYATCKGRHKDYPLVPVPPHGRLIDADALIRDWPTGFVKTADVINNAPTIIPADPAEEVE